MGPANQALVEAMRNLSVQDGPDRRSLMYQLLLESELVVPLNSPRPSTFTAFEIGTPLPIRTGSNPDGVWMPVFTSLDTLGVWSPDDLSHTVAPGPAVFEMVEPTAVGHVVIDPGSETWGILSRREIDDLAHGVLPIGIDTQLLTASGRSFEVPREKLPMDGINAVREVISGMPGLHRAFITSLRQDGVEVGLSIVACAAPGTPDDVVTRMVDELAAGARRGAPVVDDWTFLSATPYFEARLEAGAGAEIYRR